MAISDVEFTPRRDSSSQVGLGLPTLEAGLLQIQAAGFGYGKQVEGLRGGRSLDD